jgi:hypothetical protein
MNNIGDAMLKMLSTHLRNEPMTMLPFNGDSYRRWVLHLAPNSCWQCAGAPLVIVELELRDRFPIALRVCCPIEGSRTGCTFHRSPTPPPLPHPHANLTPTHINPRERLYFGDINDILLEHINILRIVHRTWKKTISISTGSGKKQEIVHVGAKDTIYMSLWGWCEFCMEIGLLDEVSLRCFRVLCACAHVWRVACGVWRVACERVWRVRARSAPPCTTTACSADTISHTQSHSRTCVT